MAQVSTTDPFEPITNLRILMPGRSMMMTGGHRLGRVVLKVNPMAVHSILERVTTEDDEGPGDRSPEEEEEEGAAHSLKDVCDFGKPEPSPFSSRRVMYENEEVGATPKRRMLFQSISYEHLKEQGAFV